VTYDMNQLEMSIPGLSDCLSFIDAPLVDISSEQIRERLAEGRTVRYQTPDGVIEYIHQHRLYQDN
jgi:nicotinate-nucleotide adenylyltransferase